MSDPTRADRLRAHIESAGPVVWGESDCCSHSAAWAFAETGRRIALPAYGSRPEADAMIAAAGGLLNLAAPILAGAGYARAYQPELGDVVILRMTGKDVMAIWCGNGIAAWRCDQRGYVFVPVRTDRIVAAWSVQ